MLHENKVVLIFYMSVFIIKVERKARRPRAELMLRGDSVQDSLRMSRPGRLLFISQNYSSAPPLALSATVVQLFNSWLVFTPGGGICGIS